MYVFGSGDCGQLGLGEDDLECALPRRIDYLGNSVVEIAAGGLHNLALTSDGTVFSWGCNDEKALGHDAPEWTIDSVKGLPEGDPVVKIACGDSISAALTRSGALFTWGTFRDSQGVLGFDAKGTLLQDRPTLLAGLSGNKIIQIAAGANHLIALSDSSSLFSWGCGEQGQLGRRILERHKKGALLPQNVTPRLKRRETASFGALACGSYHTLALRSDGLLYSWGLNNYGQLGLGDLNPRLIAEPLELQKNIRFTMMAAGEHHSLALSRDGLVFSWGRGDSGQLGLSLDAPTSISIPQQIPPQYFSNIPVTQLASGSNHCLALDSSNQLYAWGFGEMMQLGNGKEKDEFIPYKVGAVSNAKILQIAAGGQHSMLLVSS